MAIITQGTPIQKVISNGTPIQKVMSNGTQIWAATVMRTITIPAITGVASQTLKVGSTTIYSGAGGTTVQVEQGSSVIISAMPATGYNNPVVTTPITANSNFSTANYITAGSKKPFSVAEWDEIDTIAAAGNASNFYAVGDAKNITMTTGEVITVVILGFNHDDLTAGGKAQITIGMENLLATTYQMNGTNTNVGGWHNSAMRTSTMATLLSQLPIDLQAAIKQVNKKASAGSQSSSITTSADKLWLLSEVEVDATLSDVYADEGVRYDYWKTIKNGVLASNRKKRLSNGSGSASSWWVRSSETSLSTSFHLFTSSGAEANTGAAQLLGVSFGFCI